MKILYIINNLTKGGAERFVLDLITYLNRNTSIDYRLAVLDGVNNYDEYDVDILNLTNLNYSTFSLRKKNENPVLKRLLDDFQPDIIHTNLFLSEFSTVLDVRKDIKYVCHGHDNMHQFEPLRFIDFFNKQKVLNRIEYFILKYKKYNRVQTYFIANSIHTYSYFQKRVPKNQRNNVRLIQCGFNYEKYFQKNHQSLDGKIRLINVGSYQQKKNQQFIIDIAEVLRDKRVDFEINLIGHGLEFENVKQKIENKKLSNYVFQRGLQSNVQEWYQKSDLYLHSATYEPFGLVFLEAMAAGLPIITLDGQGNRDIITNDKNGFLFYEENAELFADKIIEFTTDKNKYKEMSGYAQAYAKTFDVSIKNKKLIEFYKSILD